MVAWTWQKSSCIAVVSGGLLLLSIFISILTLTGKGSKIILTHYISYNGGGYPENGVFSLLLYFSAMFGSLLMIMRYVDVESRAMYKSTTVDYVNKISLFVGIIAMVSMAVVASYPITSGKEVNHFNKVGTYVMFVGCTIYCGIHTGFSFYFLKCSPCFITRLLVFGACVTAIIASPTILSHAVRPVHNETMTTSENITVSAFSHSPEDSSSSYVIASTICQRIVVLAFSVFQLSFICEFKKVSGYAVIRSDAAPSPTVSLGDSWVQVHKSWNAGERF